jgi:hypothetical protein
MSMSQSEIFLHLNLNDGWVDLACRVDELAFEISDGHLKVESDLDSVVALTLTSAGRKLLRPTLPIARDS